MNRQKTKVCISALIFSFINIHGYASEIILCMTIGRNDLSNCITDDITTVWVRNQFMYALYAFAFFSEVFTNIEYYTERNF